MTTQFVNKGPCRYRIESYERIAESMIAQFFAGRGAVRLFSLLEIHWVDQIPGSGSRMGKVRVLPAPDNGSSPRGIRLGVQPQGNDTGREVLVVLPTDAWQGFGFTEPNPDANPDINWDMQAIRAKLAIVKTPVGLTEAERAVESVISILKCAHEAACRDSFLFRLLMALFETLRPQWEALHTAAQGEEATASAEQRTLKAKLGECETAIARIQAEFPAHLHEALLAAAHEERDRADIDVMEIGMLQGEALQRAYSLEELVGAVSHIEKYAKVQLEAIAADQE